jgi:hypothetical protein
MTVKPKALVVVCVLLAVVSTAAKMKTRVDFDKKFDFKQARTWQWNPKGPGDVYSTTTEPDKAKANGEELLMKTVEEEMTAHGLKVATADADLTVTYYLLLSVGSAAQTMGQFLPSTAAWGIPPYAPSTQSLEVIEQGSLVLDLASHGNMVWRGVAQAKMDMGLERRKRIALIPEAVHEILKRYPIKKVSS